MEKEKAALKKIKQFLYQSKFFILTLVVALLVSYYLFNFHNYLAQYGDYSFSLWVTSYMGEFFRRHHAFAMGINTEYFVGLIHPLFYGFGFFRLTGLLSILLGGTLTLRIIFIALFLLQATCVYRLFASLSQDRLVAFCVSALMSLSIYPLTNLYIRGAIAEFVATTLLVCGFCFLLKLLLLPNQQSFRDKWALGLCFSGALLTHPITFKYGTVFAIISVLPLLPFINLKKFIGWSIPTALFILVVVSPWLYLLLAHPTSEIVSRWSHSSGFPALTADLDTIWTRLKLYPFDGRALHGGMDVSTPYLDAQINMPLMLLNAILFLCCWSKVTWKEATKRIYLVLGINSLILFLLILVLSVKANPYLSAFLDQAQFGYRLITYINLSALCFTASLTPFLNAENNLWKRWREIIISSVVTIAIVGFMIQDAHIRLHIKKYIPEWSKSVGKGDRNQVLMAKRPTDIDFPYYDYIITKVFDEKGQSKLHVGTKEVKFPVGRDEQFGESSPITVNLQKRTLIETNVFPFPWNHIKLDGKLLSADQLMMNADAKYKKEIGLRFLLEPGAHTIEYKFIPDPTWSYLNIASMIAMMLWLLSYFMHIIYSHIKLKK